MKSLLYLASASPRRHELLNQIGVEHTVLTVPSPPGEDEPRQANETPLEYVKRTAQEKANRAQTWVAKEKVKLFPTSSNQSIGILTADTTVALEDLVLGKPSDHDHAAYILRLLSGKTHTVYTALVLSETFINRPSEISDCLKRDEETYKWNQWSALSTTFVSFGTLTQLDIYEYISTGEPFGKAGAYGIQGYAARFIRKIEGSYSGVMGLPLFETGELLKQRNQ